MQALETEVKNLKRRLRDDLKAQSKADAEEAKEEKVWKGLSIRCKVETATGRLAQDLRNHKWLRRTVDCMVEFILLDRNLHRQLRDAQAPMDFQAVDQRNTLLNLIARFLAHTKPQA